MHQTAVKTSASHHAQTSRVVLAVETAIAMLLLMLPALCNRFPLLEYDTGGYLARWYEGYLVPSRPAPYGLFLNIGSFFDFWPVVFIQSAATVWAAGIAMRTHGLQDRPLARMILFASLSALTTLPFLTSVLLTDIFAGLAVLALYLLVIKRGALTQWQAGGLTALAAFGAATHSATLLLTGALAFAVLLLRWTTPRLLDTGATARVAAALALGLAILLSANFIVTKRLAWTPGGYGIVFGRMLQDGIVHRFLGDRCPSPRFRLCAHVSELPHDADEFLWGGDLFTKLGRFDGLGEEMRQIVLESLAAYPLWQIEAAASASARQLVRVRTGEGVLPTIWHTYGMIGNFTPWNLPAMRAARQQHGELNFDAINTLHVPIALLSMALLLIPVFGMLRRRPVRDTECLAATVAFALLCNACILGPLSNPHDRYGARLIWLAPFAVALWAGQRPAQKRK